MFKNVDLFQIDKASWASCVIFGTRKGGVQAGTQLRGVLEIKKKLLAALRHQRQVPHSQLCRLDILGGALDGVAVLGGELGDELQQRGALVLDGLAVAAQQGLVLSRQDVDARLQLGQTVSDVMHQQPDIYEFRHYT